jgi:hypothetical protein
MGYNYEDYEKAGIKLFKKMFGESLLESIQEVELKSFEWDDEIDIKVSEITKVVPSIKQRFENLYEEERDNQMGLFIQQIFLMGYQSSVEKEVQPLKENITMYQKCIVEDSKVYEMLLKEIKELKEINQQLIDGCETGVDSIFKNK